GRLRGTAAGRADGARGPEPAALPVGAGTAPGEAEAAGRRRAAPARAEAGAAPPGRPGADRRVGRDSRRGPRRRPAGGRADPGAGGDGGAGGRGTLCSGAPGAALSLQALAFARGVGEVRAVSVDGPYQPAAWARALAAEPADAIVAAGSDRGNELLAHVAALL